MRIVLWALSVVLAFLAGWGFGRSGVRPSAEQAANAPRFPHSGEVIIVTGIGASSSLDDEWE